MRIWLFYQLSYLQQVINPILRRKSVTVTLVTQAWKFDDGQETEMWIVLDSANPIKVLIGVIGMQLKFVSCNNIPSWDYVKGITAVMCLLVLQNMADLAPSHSLLGGPARSISTSCSRGQCDVHFNA